MSASSGGDLMRTGLEPLVMMGKKEEKLLVMNIDITCSYQKWYIQQALRKHCQLEVL